MGKTDAIRVGVGMVPRGEVGMVVAQIGRNFGVMEAGVYGIIVFMSVATTLVAPPLLKLAFRGAPQRIESDEQPVRLG
jgi:Kef-type K+ transport system membrane component KefB